MAKDSLGSIVTIGNYVKFLPSGLGAYDPTSVTVIGVIMDMQVGDSDIVGLDIQYLNQTGLVSHDYKQSDSVTLVVIP